MPAVASAAAPQAPTLDVRATMAAVAAAPKASALGTGIDMLLYTSGPFFGNPLKAPLQAALGKTGYDRAYAHFARDHNTTANLALHVVALAWQVAGNFAYLARLDELTRRRLGGEYLSATTAVGWSALLVVQPAPAASRALAVAMIAAGYAARKRLAAQWERAVLLAGVLEAGTPAVRFGNAWTFVRLLLLRYAAWAALSRRRLRGAAEGQAGRIAAALVPTFLALAYKNHFSPFVFAFLGWPLSLLTGESAFFLHSCAYTASFLQGIAHGLADEEGTLTQLHNAHDELAHCVYFPVLLLHRVQRALAARR